MKYITLLLLAWLTCASAALSQGTGAIPNGFPQDSGSGSSGSGTLGTVLTITTPTIDLPNARVLTPTVRFVVTDNGAGASWRLELATVAIAFGGTGATTQQGAADAVLNFPSEATGDLAYFNGTHWARLPIGSASQVLAVSGGIPAWTSSGAAVNGNANFYLDAADATMPNAGVVTAGTGITKAFVAGGTATIAVDTTVVATTTNVLTMTNKTLTAPSMSAPTITAARTTGFILAGSSFNDTVKIADPAAARTLTIPDPGAAASFVMTEGAQSVNGVKTFGAAPVLSTNTITSSTGNTITFPDSTDTLVNLADVQTLRNKTLTSPAIGTQIQLNQTTANYIIQWDNPGTAGNRTYHVNDINSPGSFLLYDGATASYTGGQVLYTDGTGVKALANGSAGQALVSNGGTAAPSWAGVLLFGGNGSDGAVSATGATFTSPKVWYATTFLTVGAPPLVGGDFTICATSTVTLANSTTVYVHGTGFSGGAGQATASEKGRSGYGSNPGEGGDHDFLAANPAGGGGGGSVVSTGGNGGGTGGGLGGIAASNASAGYARYGSGGGSGGSGAGGSSADAGAGGGSVRVYARGAVVATSTGSIDANANAGGNGTTLAGGSGGGSGGTFWVFSQASIATNANWQAIGGNGGTGTGTASGGGGGGAGGLAYIMSPSNTTTFPPQVGGGTHGAGTGANGTDGAAGIFSNNTQTPTLPTVVYADDMRGIIAQVNLQRGRKWLATGMKEVDRVDSRQHENVTWQAAWYAAPGQFDNLCYMLNFGGDPNKAVALADNVFKLKTATNPHTIYDTLAECKADPACLEAFPPEAIEQTCIGDFVESGEKAA